MPKFLLILRDDPTKFTALSPEHMQCVIQKYVAWGRRVREGGTTVRGEKLRDDVGRVVRRDGDRLRVSDGPFLETKEAVGGFYELEAPSLEAVLKLVEDHPQLDNGCVEVRQIEEF